MASAAESTKLQFFTKTRELWASMYEDCRTAKKSIDFEQYIIRDDKTGRRFMELFVQKAKEGVRLRLLFDRIGSRALYSSSMVKDLREADGQVYFYNAI